MRYLTEYHRITSLMLIDYDDESQTQVEVDNQHEIDHTLFFMLLFKMQELKSSQKKIQTTNLNFAE